MFAVADAYDRFMGRYSTLLAPQMADLAGIAAGQRALDVGSGPGALTRELVRRLGAANVAAVDPSAPFIAALRERLPGIDARVASAESLPFVDRTFDAAVAQLVVHFMTDPVAGLREMARVTRHGGIVAACVWDHAGARGPLVHFWRAAREVVDHVEDESQRAGAREGHLAVLFTEAGLHTIETTTVTARLTHTTFESWWQPFELGVGPAGAFLQTLDPARRLAIRERARSRIVADGLTWEALAWAARGIVA